MFARVAAITILVVQFGQLTAPLVCPTVASTSTACSESMSASSGSHSSVTTATADRASINQMLCGVQVPVLASLMGPMSLVTHLGFAITP